MRAKVILNPDADQATPGDHKPAVERSVERVLESAGIQSDLVVARRPGRATQEAIAASFGPYDAIIAAGCNRTVHEVINGLISGAGSGPTRPLGILPIGLDSDFSDTAGLPRDLTAAAQVIADGHIHPVDAGRVSFTCDDDLTQRDVNWQRRFFGNNCAAAMELLAATETTGSAPPAGDIGYGFALTQSPPKLKSWHMKIAWDAGAYEGPVSLLSVANSPRTVGHIAIAPNAMIDDGFFDFVFVPELSRSETLDLLARLSEGGRLSHSLLYSGRTTQLHVESRPGTPLWADGEIIAEAARIASYRILPGKVSLIAP